MFKNFLKFCVPPLAIFGLLRLCLWLSPESGINPDLKTALEYIAHLTLIFAYIGFGGVVFDEVFHESIWPKLVKAWQNTAKTWLDDKISELKNDIMKKDLIINFTPREAYFQDKEKEVDAELIRTAMTGQSDDQQVKEALNFAYHGEAQKAIALLENIAKANPRRKKDLLSALTMSDNEIHWKQAESMLNECGEPVHFNRIALAYWKTDRAKNVNHSVTLAERGLKLVHEGRSADAQIVGTLKNSLAYYYADAGRVDKKEEASKLAASELERRKLIGENYAEVLDTSGYIKISLGKSIAEIKQGMSECTDAYALGSTEDLYIIHMKKGRDRLKNMRS